MSRSLPVLVAAFLAGCAAAGAGPDPTVPRPAPRPHVVFVTGDEEYRSEESMPMLAAILERDFAVRTTVLYALAEDGTIDPNRTDHIPGTDALRDADLLVMFARHRALPESQLRPILDHVAAGKPVTGFRTSTHAFKYPPSDGRAADLNEVWPARVFGQKWITHHGHLGDNEKRLTGVSTLPAAAGHPVLRGVGAFEAWSWLYHVEGGGDRLAPGCVPLLQGRALASNHDQSGTSPRFPVVQPVAWVREAPPESGLPRRTFFTTLGHPFDFREPAMRRFALQGILWALGREDLIPESGVRADPAFPYEPAPSGFGSVFKPGRRPPAGYPGVDQSWR